MLDVVLFGEDRAHHRIVGSLVQRLARESRIAVRLDWQNSRGGHGRTLRKYHRYLRELERMPLTPDLLVVATDANCLGLKRRIQEFSHAQAHIPTVLAIPDPHIERWLLLDGAAFKAVLGRGCKMPDQKCSRDRYKQLLNEEIQAAGDEAYLDGIEYAEDIVEHMDLERAARADVSLQRFIQDLRAVFRHWQP